jgi:hypothetical protein
MASRAPRSFHILLSVADGRVKESVIQQLHPEQLRFEEVSLYRALSLKSAWSMQQNHNKQRVLVRRFLNSSRSSRIICLPLR